MSQYSEGQAHQVMEAMEARGFTAGQLTILGQNQGGILDQLKLVILGLATIVRASLKLALDKVFIPAEFIGNGWNVWKGAVDGNGLEGKEEAVSEPEVVDFKQVVLETHLQDKEISIHGEEKLKRARASQKRQLGGNAFLALWANWQSSKAVGKPEDSILEKLYKVKKIGGVIYFFGLTLRDPDGDRGVLYLYRGDDGSWYWSYGWLDNRWVAGDPSVSLASVK